MKDHTKCPKCRKKLIKLISQCKECKHFFHKKCEPSLKKQENTCSSCLMSHLPFYKLEKLQFIDHLELQPRTPNCPSFNIQSLLDDMKMNNDDSHFITDSIKSSYYDTNEFISAKFPKNAFSILHLNTASLQLHFDEIVTMLSQSNKNFDILCFSETKIKEKTGILRNIDIPGYSFFHTDTKTNSGGTLIYAKNQLSPKLLPEFSQSVENIFESTFIEIKNEKKSMIIGTIYRHPKADSSFISSFLEPTLSKLGKTKKKIAITGDFNFDLLKYDLHNPTNEFYDLLSSFSYRPCILQPSRVTSKTNTLIDNIFINDLSCNLNGGNLTYKISDHFTQFVFCDAFGKIPPKKEIKYKRNFKNFKNEEYIEELHKINWSILDHFDTDNAFKALIHQHDSLLNVMAPLKRSTKRELRLEIRPWITKGILKSMKTRDSLYKKLTAKENLLNKQLTFENHRKYRNIIVTLLRRSKENYFQKFFEKNKADIKKTWKGIKNILSISKKKATYIPYLTYKGQRHSSNSEKANALCDFYTNIGQSVENKIPISKKTFEEYLPTSNNTSILHRPCTHQELAKIINSLNASKASGPNSIPTRLIHTASLILVPVLTKLINKSLTKGIFPSILKLAEICPIFKKGDLDDCGNYRPISLLSNIGKILEKVMYSRISTFLEECNILFDNQFGFRKNHSTNHALVNMIEQIKQNLDNKMYTCGVFVDLEKAFDTVNHNILIKKLEHYGIRGPYNEWLKTYLTERKQTVTIGESKSFQGKITCGVPQGSVLGPLLFLIYINDMNTAVKSSIIHHFADDTNLIGSHKNIKTLTKSMNKDLACLFDWLCANRLSLNAKKTEIILFRPNNNIINQFKLRINQSTIKESIKIKYLGVLLDNKLSWKFHIAELSKKLSRAIGMLYQMRNLCNIETMKSIYFSLFHSHLIYGISVWGLAKTSLTNNVFKLQKRAIRIISKSDYLAHTDPLFKKLSILKSHDQYLLNLSSMMWDYDHNKLPKSLNKWFKKTNHQHLTRFATTGKLQPCTISTKKIGDYSFRNEGTQILNLLKDTPLYNDSISKTAFTKKMKLALLQSY